MRNFFLFPFAAGPKASANADDTMSYFSPFMPSEETGRAGNDRNLLPPNSRISNLSDDSTSSNG